MGFVLLLFLCSVYLPFSGGFLVLFFLVSILCSLFCLSPFCILYLSLDCPFGFLLSLSCPSLCIVHCWLPLRFSLIFTYYIHNKLIEKWLNKFGDLPFEDICIAMNILIHICHTVTITKRTGSGIVGIVVKDFFTIARDKIIKVSTRETFIRWRRRWEWS